MSLLDEYDAVVAKVDAAVAAASATAELTCRAGCDSCCVSGLTVLPVEAASLVRFAEDHELDFAPKGQGHCVFLDVDGRCAVYAARPILCRTHGLPLRMPGEAPRGSLRVLTDDVTVCSLNFTTRAPTKSETLDATTILKLLVTVDRRYREHAGLDDDTARVALADLVASEEEDEEEAGEG